jgi:hypothetical protein
MLKKENSAAIRKELKAITIEISTINKKHNRLQKNLSLSMFST